MSQRDSTRFLEFVGSGQGVADAFVDAVGERQGDPAYEAVSAFARQHGYDVDPADARLMQAALIQGADLRDEELGGIAGGVSLEDAATAVAVIGGGPINLIANAIEGRHFLSQDNAFARFMKSW